MAKHRTHKQVRHYKGEIKRLQAEIKRLKKEPLDKDDTPDSVLSNQITPCFHCKTGFMSRITIVGKEYMRCCECGRTKSLTNSV